MLKMIAKFVHNITTLVNQSLCNHDWIPTPKGDKFTCANCKKSV